MRSDPPLWLHSNRLYAGRCGLSCHTDQASDQDTAWQRPHGAGGRKKQEQPGRERLPGGPTEPRLEIQPFWRPNYIPALEIQTPWYPCQISPLFIYKNLSSFLLYAIKEYQVTEQLQFPQLLSREKNTYLTSSCKESILDSQHGPCYIVQTP